MPGRDDGVWRATACSNARAKENAHVPQKAPAMMKRKSDDQAGKAPKAARPENKKPEAKPLPTRAAAAAKTGFVFSETKKPPLGRAKTDPGSVAKGTPGSRAGPSSALAEAENNLKQSQEDNAAITQAIVEFRIANGIGGPVILGKDTTIEFEDYLNVASNAPEAAVPVFQVHEAMEVKLGLF